jgi:hypothetical protein
MATARPTAMATNAAWAATFAVFATMSDGTLYS